MHVIAIPPQKPRNRLDRSVLYSEKRLKRPRLNPPLGVKHPKPRDCARPSAIRSEETLDRTASSGNLDLNRQATWGMSVQFVIDFPRLPTRCRGFASIQGLGNHRENKVCDDGLGE